MTSDSKISKIHELFYEIRVSDVMKRDVFTVSPRTHMSVLRVILRENRISGTPVIDKGKMVGVISVEDFIKWLANREQDCPIGEKMTRNVQTLYADEPLIHAINKFERHGFGRLVVIERQDKRLLGIVTKGDIIEGLLKKLEIDYYEEEEVCQYRVRHFFEDILADRAELLFQYDVIGHDFKRAGESASRVKTTLRRLGLHPKIIRRVAIATFEAEMNLIVYTDGGKICVRVEPNEIFVKVEDSGPGILDVERALQPGYSTAPEWVRELGFGAGMGLNNIQKCANKMDLRSTVGKGTQLSFYISIEDGAKNEIN
ncbi:MAG TPA: CBS domain-containing protein [Sedimentisphaerales bacterium]|nr:CBS domain-containing protein [Sedimentisphaerales bacterium]